MSKKKIKEPPLYVTRLHDAYWEAGAIKIVYEVGCGAPIARFLSPEYAMQVHAALGRLLAERYPAPVIDEIDLKGDGENIAFSLIAQGKTLGAGRVNAHVARKTKRFLRDWLPPENVVSLRGRA